MPQSVLPWITVRRQLRTVPLSALPYLQSSAPIWVWACRSMELAILEVATTFESQRPASSRSLKILSLTVWHAGTVTIAALNGSFPYRTIFHKSRPTWLLDHICLWGPSDLEAWILFYRYYVRCRSVQHDIKPVFYASRAPNMTDTNRWGEYSSLHITLMPMIYYHHCLLSSGKWYIHNPWAFWLILLAALPWLHSKSLSRWSPQFTSLVRTFLL